MSWIAQGLNTHDVSRRHTPATMKEKKSARFSQGSLFWQSRTTTHTISVNHQIAALIWEQLLLFDGVSLFSLSSTLDGGWYERVWGTGKDTEVTLKWVSGL